MIVEIEIEEKTVTCSDCTKEFYPDNENEKFCSRCNALFYISVEENEGDFLDQ